MIARVSAAVVALVAIATLSACNPKSKTVGAPATPATTTAATTTPAAAAGSSISSAASASASAPAPAPASGPAKSIDICTAVPPATVVKLTGKPYTVATPGAANSGADGRCAYDDVDNTDSGVTLTVWFENAETTWQAVHTGTLTDISGVGDKAFWDNTDTLYAVSGSTLIQVNGFAVEGPTVALAKALLAALH